jgi:hypothetical protein
LAVASNDLEDDLCDTVQALMDQQEQIDRLRASEARLQEYIHMAHARDSAEIERLRAENDALKGHLSEAIDEIENWGLYASEYFQQKHGLQETVDRLRAAMRGAA